MNIDLKLHLTINKEDMEQVFDEMEVEMTTSKVSEIIEHLDKGTNPDLHERLQEALKEIISEYIDYNF